MSDPFAELQNDMQDTTSIDGDEELFDVNTSVAATPDETMLEFSHTEKSANDYVPRLRSYSSESGPENEGDDFGSNLVAGKYQIYQTFYFFFVFCLCQYLYSYFYR